MSSSDAEWKKLAETRLRDLKELQESYEEFEETSKEVEEALESDLKESQIKILKLERSNEKLQSDRASTVAQCDRMREKIAEMESKEQEIATKLRALELDNDDLQRHRRMDSASLEQLRGDLEQAEEDLVIYREEAEEQKRLHLEEIQHLRDDLRDAKDESVAIQRKLDVMASAVPRDQEEAGGKKQSLQGEIQRLRNDLRDAKDTSLEMRKKYNSLREINESLRSLKVATARELSQYKRDFASKISLILKRVKSSALAFKGAGTSRDLKVTKKDTIRGGIRVMVRIRPPICGVSKRVPHMSVTALAQTSMEVRAWDESGLRCSSARPFSFDMIFPPDSSQDAVFRKVHSYADTVWAGFNCCIMAYGQTGAGKTYTIDGIGRRIVRRIVDLCDSASVAENSASLAIVEIYNDSVRDLLCGSKVRELKMARSKSASSMYTSDSLATTPWSTSVRVQGLKWIPIRSEGDAIAALALAKTQRATGATNSNAHSSRSHCVFMYKVSTRDDLTGHEQSAVLFLVDLAGSERLQKSGAVGIRKDETRHINKSLSTLGDVMHSLDAKFGRRVQGKRTAKPSTAAVHIPYRNSKLTYLLKDALGGSCATLLIAAVRAENDFTSETLSTLEFAERCRSLDLSDVRKNVRRRNEAADLKREIKEQRRTIRDLSATIKTTKATVRDLEMRLSESSNALKQARAKSKSHTSSLSEMKKQYQEKMRSHDVATKRARRVEEGLQAKLRSSEMSLQKLKERHQMNMLRRKEEKRADDDIMFRAEVSARATRARRRSESGAARNCEVKRAECESTATRASLSDSRIPTPRHSKRKSDSKSLSISKLRPPSSVRSSTPVSLRRGGSRSARLNAKNRGASTPGASSRFGYRKNSGTQTKTPKTPRWR